MMRQGARAGATTKQQGQQQYTSVAEPPEWQFARACEEYGLRIDGPIEAGRLVRCTVHDKRHSTQKPGWYLFHGVDLRTGFAVGHYGDWRHGSAIKWCNRDPAELSADDRRHLQAAEQAARAQREAEQADRRQQAAWRAAKMWGAAAPATEAHPYLQAKQIPAVGVRELSGWLLIPLQDAQGLVHNLQRIDVRGQKLFLPGGRVRGLFYLVGAIEADRPLYLCEGFATGAAIHKATGHPVACAMSANNLVPVAEALRQQHPAVALVVAADNDWRTEGNPGMRYAAEAARKVAAALTWPRVCELEGCTCTDFADTAICGRAPK